MNIPKLVSEQLTDAADTTGSVFMGLTFGCARCHDHKFDPITQRDYYRMQAVFAASAPGDIPVVPRHYQEDYRQHYTTLLVVQRSQVGLPPLRRTRAPSADPTRRRPSIARKWSPRLRSRKPSVHPSRKNSPLHWPRPSRRSNSKSDSPRRSVKRDRLLLDRIAKAVLALPEKDASQNIPFDGLMEIPSASVLVNHDSELIPEVHVLRRGELEYAG